MKANEDVDGALFRSKSANRKFSPVDLVVVPNLPRKRPVPREPFVCSTYTSIEATCPESCPFKRDANGVAGGCFADAGYTGRAIKILDAAARWHDMSPTSMANMVISQEVAHIDQAFHGKPVPQDGARGGRDLRLHVGGDVGTTFGAQLLGRAATRWRSRGGGAVWTYTHRWRDIPRSAWGPDVSVLASCETADEMNEARERGYPPAVTVPQHPSKKAYAMKGTDTKVIPCPFETKGTVCSECRLCLDVDLMKMNKAIGFAVHGPDAVVAASNITKKVKR